jgi:hypothetical protein
LLLLHTTQHNTNTAQLPLRAQPQLNSISNPKPRQTPKNKQGLAHCFRKGDDGKLEDLFVIEPLSASSLECMATGARTSFRLAYGLSLGDAASRDRARLPPELAAGVWCEDYELRLAAAARTWLRPHAQDNLM